MGFDLSSFDINLILVNLLFSGVGFVYLSFGRRTSNFPVMLTGIALMAYGYFTPSLVSCVLVGVLLSALPFVFKWWQI